MRANASRDSPKPCFYVEAHLSDLFDAEAEVPVDEAQRRQVQEAGTPDENSAGDGGYAQHKPFWLS
jgi:hypothetical protein